MAGPTEHRFSTKDYYRMAECGVLQPNARVELLEGVLRDMSPIGPFHGGVVARLDRLFNEKSEGRWLVWAQNPLHLDEFSEPEPDIMLLRPVAGDYTTRHPEPKDVFLLIEVADTSRDYDRKEKLPAYARAGIPEVWLADLQARTIEIFRKPQSAGYNNTISLRAGDQARLAAFPDVAVDVSQLMNQG